MRANRISPPPPLRTQPQGGGLEGGGGRREAAGVGRGHGAAGRGLPTRVTSAEGRPAPLHLQERQATEARPRWLRARRRLRVLEPYASSRSELRDWRGPGEGGRGLEAGRGEPRSRGLSGTASGLETHDGAALRRKAPSSLGFPTEKVGTPFLGP